MPLSFQTLHKIDNSDITTIIGRVGQVDKAGQMAKGKRGKGAGLSGVGFLLNK
jgi:hypothetical protein